MALKEISSKQMKVKIYWLGNHIHNYVLFVAFYCLKKFKIILFHEFTIFIDIGNPKIVNFPKNE